MKHTITLHLYERTASWNAGDKTVSIFDLRNDTESMSDKVWVDQRTIELDWPEIDTRQAQIDQLERQVEKERADSQVRVNLLLERISKLKCLEHKK